MPVYVFTCPGCGRFELARPLARAGDRAECPRCRGSARRVYTPPSIPVLSDATRRLLTAEEVSAHEPAVVAQKRGRPLPARPSSPAPPWVLH
jgi:putative FmdB family regulatory protein